MKIEAPTASQLLTLLQQRLEEMWDIEESDLTLASVLVDECSIAERTANALAAGKKVAVSNKAFESICFCFQFPQELLRLVLDDAPNELVRDEIEKELDDDEECEQCCFYRIALSLTDTEEGLTGLAFEVIAHAVRPPLPELEESEGRLRVLEIYDNLDYESQMKLVAAAEDIEGEAQASLEEESVGDDYDDNDA
jgi:hypothetical protein